MRKFVLLLVLGLLLQPGIASAFIELNPIQKAYSPGEYVNLGGIFTNTYTESKSVKIEQFLLHHNLAPMPGIIRETLAPDRIAVLRGIGFTVQDITKPGVYTYVINVYENETLLDSARMSFEIINSLKQFEDIKLRTCTSPDCKRLKSIFLRKETAYVRVLNSEEATLTGQVEDDFGFQKDLSFRNGVAEFKLDKLGHFRVRVLAEKHVYESREMGAEFYVIESNIMLTNLFPVFDWIYYFVIIMIFGAMVVMLISMLSTKKKRNRFGEWLKWRKWKKKREKLGYLLKPGKDLKEPVSIL